MAGTLDLASITGVPHKPKLSVMNVADDPFYIIMSMDDESAAYREICLSQMDGRNWILLGEHANAHLYDTIQSVAAHKGVHPADLYYFTSPEEAAELARKYPPAERGPCYVSRSKRLGRGR